MSTTRSHRPPHTQHGRHLPHLDTRKRRQAHLQSSNQVSDSGSSIGSLTHTSSHQTHRLAHYENTYHLTPEEHHKFSSPRVTEVLHSILDSFLKDVKYDEKRIPQMSRDISTLIKTRVKEMGFPRYKFVCFVSIGQNIGQGVSIVSRALWNTKTDTYATATYDNQHLHAVAVVYGLYHD